jgi:hypothetical protein
LARQKKLGILPPNTQLAPKPDVMQDWYKLSADEKKVFTRQQEIFAAYAEITDHEIGRVIQAVNDLGVMDNTLPPASAPRSRLDGNTLSQSNLGFPDRLDEPPAGLKLSAVKCLAACVPTILS